MALTKRGQLLYAYFKKNPDLHPTAEEVYLSLKEQDIDMGVATVYRNLKSLVAHGYLKELSLEKQGVRYDLQDDEHYHFICDTCGSIENFYLDELRNINDAVENTIQGIITSKDFVFHGTCKTCLDRKQNR